MLVGRINKFLQLIASNNGARAEITKANDRKEMQRETPTMEMTGNHQENGCCNRGKRTKQREMNETHLH